MAARQSVVDPQRLRRTVSEVVRKLQPDQIILFGSAARNEMSPDSDVDLLVITDRLNGGPSVQQERWYAEDAARYEADLVLMSRKTAEAGRASVTRVQGVALEDGRTVYARIGVDPVPTGPTYFWNGREMVKTTKYEPDEAARLIEDAELKWTYARHPASLPRHRCRELHASIEYALKGLTVAQGARVEHKHTLNELWDDLEARGESIPVARDRSALEELTRYSGKLRYDDPDLAAGTDPVALWDRTRTTGRDLLSHAKQRVPQPGPGPGSPGTR